jgi:hypothetical protein
MQVPELCRMDGIIIKMMNMDVGQHSKPHIHVYYGEYQASISLKGELLAGSLPSKQFSLVVAWLVLRENEVYAAWAKAISGEPFGRIDPIK